METLTSPLSAFTEWLTEHLDELVDNVLTAVQRDSIPGSALCEDPALRSVLRSETKLLFTRLLTELERGRQGSVRVPEARHIARLAALHGTPLEDLTNAYWVAHSVVQDAYFRAAKESDIPSASALQIIRHGCRHLFRQTSAIVGFVTDEYEDALRGHDTDENAVRLQLVQSLLHHAEPPVRQSLYDLDTDHVAVVASGAAAEALCAYAGERGRRGLSAFIDRRVAWGWCSGATPQQVQDVVLAKARTGGMGIGSPGRGPAGFRQSHLQAQSAYRVCERTGRRSARFADVMPEAMGLADADSARGLVRRHLGRLARGGSREAVLRETLTAYLASGQTARATAAKLGLTERTIANRLQTIRTLLPAGTELSSLELALALRLMPLVTGNEPEPARGAGRVG